MRAAYLHEVENRDEEHRVVLTGRFTVSLQLGDDWRSWPEDTEHPDLVSALAFARERADRVFVDLGGERHLAPLDDELVAGASGRRRLPGQEWLDRTALDEPIPYVVRLEVMPRRFGDRAAERPVVDAVAAALAADGFRDVELSESERDDALREIEAQFEAAGRPEGDFGWMVSGSLAYVLHAVVDARTHREAIARAGTLARDAADGGAWLVTADAWPAGAEDPGA